MMTEEHDYICKESFLSRFIPDQTVIIKKRILKYIHGVKEPVDLAPPPDESIIETEEEGWYPSVNSYYSFTEDVDAYARVQHLLEAEHYTNSVEKTPPIFVNEYFSKKAQQQFLHSKPTCFLILGKPGLGEEEVGRKLAEQRKCVYISPMTLLEDEIASGSRPGQCIEFNLRCGRSIGIDVLARLLAKKVQTTNVVHRGFVLSGFPLIPNDLYEEDPISSESAVFNVREIFEELIDQTLLISDVSANVAVSLAGSSKSEPVKDSDAPGSPEDASLGGIKMSMEWATENPICGPAEIATDLGKQLNCIFGLFRDPFMIIYIYCRNSDAVTIRDNYYFDIYSNKNLDMQKIKLFFQVGASNDELTEDLFGGGGNPFAENPTLKHLVKLPENFPANVNTQLDRYHNELVNILDCRILQHEHQYYIKLDARSFICEMVDLIQSRLKLLPIQPVLVPEKFVPEEEGTESEPKNMSTDEALLNFAKRDTPARMFQWECSDWESFDPVAMYHGVYQKGSPQHAVHFMSKIYFLSNEKNLGRFIDNPRRYLLPPFPKPASNVFIFGPPASGKSTVAKCLSFFLNSKVLTPGEMHQTYYDEAVREHVEKTKQSALAEAMEILKEEFSKKSEEYEELVKEWEDESVGALKKFIELVNLTDTVIELSSFPVLVEQEVTHRTTLGEFDYVKHKLVQLNFPEDINEEYCKKVLEDRALLYDHLPQNLKEMPEPPSVLDPFVLEYVDGKVAEINYDEIKEKVFENVYEIYTTIIRSIENQNEFDGWIIDGMVIDEILLQQLCEEFHIYEILILSSSNVEFLLKRFREENKRVVEYRDFRDFFLRLGEKDAAFRAPSRSTMSFKQQTAHDMVSLALDAVFDEEVIEQENFSSAMHYETALFEYQEKIENVHKLLKNLEFAPIIVNIDELSIEQLLEEVIYSIQDKYRREASEFTESDRAAELQKFLAEVPVGGEGEGIPEVVEDILAKNTRYGDTYYYCPVVFANKFVLWRGKEDFAVKFKDKIYFCSNETNMKSFLKFPRKYLLQTSPPAEFPPPRVCIIGPNQELTVKVAHQLANNLGVRYYSYDTIKQEALDTFSGMSLLVQSQQHDLPLSLVQFEYENMFQKNWFDESNKHVGFVICGFPPNEQGVKSMVTHEAIPEIVLYVTMSKEEHLKKELEKSLREWKQGVERLRQDEETMAKIIMDQWEEQRKTRYNELMEMKRQQRYTKRVEQTIAPDLSKEERELQTTDFLSDTQISVDSILEQQERDETMRILDEEFPEPVFDYTHDESQDAAIEKFTGEIETDYDTRVKDFADIKKICEEELIPFVEIDGNREFEKVIRHAFIIGNDLKFKGPSFFERCYDVPLDIAEKLLSSGYYLYSSFGRFCPVQYYDKENPIHMYSASERKGRIYPIIHRQYIYFISGKTNRARFFKNPLKYTTQTPFNFSLIPLRVAVIGPPKSGKTSLGNRFKNDLGFRLVTRGQAIRYTLSNPLCSNLISSLEKVLRKGGVLPDKLVMDCVYVASLCGECVTQGLIFDGFPNTISEMTELSRLGLVPHLIFDLNISDAELDKQATNPNEKYPQYSLRFLLRRLDEWNKSQESFRVWCNREYQNIFQLAIDRSIWGVWENAKKILFPFVFERKYYYDNAKLDMALRLSSMLVTPLEFLQRQSSYKTYCPACLYHSQSLIKTNSPPDRQGLIHYRKYFYWLCDKHIDEFLKTPSKFVLPNNVDLPQELPEVAVLTEPPEAPIEGGFCLVCYRSNFPEKILIKGTTENVVKYKGNYYMFDKLKCLKNFLTNPQKTCNMTINFKSTVDYTDLGYKELPVLGMLEQFVSKAIVKAVNSANLHRPVIPGLSVSQAALIYVGLHLKVDRKGTKYLKKYVQALEKFHERRLNLLKYLETMKKFINPMVNYEEPDTPSETEFEIDEDEEKPKILPKIYSSIL